VDTHMRRLREKLGTEAELLETIRGVGYRFRGTE
jgi:two-component system phosphate regulon response regulator PhoB